jgi:hypothetical protein
MLEHWKQAVHYTTYQIYSEKIAENEDVKT